MFENIEWVFFDVGSTIIDEHIAYEHRMKAALTEGREPEPTMRKSQL